MKKLAPYAHWLLRIALAAVFLYHGLTKFPNAEKLSLMMEIQTKKFAIYYPEEMNV